jgi:hypothetical protein
MKQLFLPLLMMIIFTNAYTQGPPPPEDEDPDAPLDGGITLLVAAGIGYGIKKACTSRRDKESR